MVSARDSPGRVPPYSVMSPLQKFGSELRVILHQPVVATPQVVAALTPCIHLIVVGAVGKTRALLHKFRYPRRDTGMRKVPVASLHLRRNRRRAGHLPAFRIDLFQTGNLSASATAARPARS